MKRWLRWGMAATLMMGTVVGSGTLSPQPAPALTQDEILEKLQPIPVFLLGDNEGNLVPLSFEGETASGETDESASFLGIFISFSDAQDTLATLQEASPAANQLSIFPVTLAYAYELILNSQDVQDSPPFAFIPQEEQLDLAAQLLLEQGEEEVRLNLLTVPLFHISGANDDESYITISLGDSDREHIPLFFDGNEALAWLELLKEDANNETGEALDIELRVVFLHQWLQVFETENEALNLVELWPIPESQALLARLRDQIQQQLQEQQAQQELPPSGQSAEQLLPEPESTPAPTPPEEVEEEMPPEEGILEEENTPEAEILEEEPPEDEELPEAENAPSESEIQAEEEPQEE